MYLQIKVFDHKLYWDVIISEKYRGFRRALKLRISAQKRSAFGNLHFYVSQSLIIASLNPHFLKSDLGRGDDQNFEEVVLLRTRKQFNSE